jgi:hypothetical protein
MVWVDNLLLFTSTDRMMIKLKEQLNPMFELTNLSESSKIIGIKISQSADSITIAQIKYVESILHKHGMDHANPVTLLNPNAKLEPNKKNREPNCSNNYASLIGSLQYLATAMHPDIAYAINRLAAYTTNPSLKHYTAAKCILRYLKGTKNYRITYHTNSI